MIKNIVKLHQQYLNDLDVELFVVDFLHLRMEIIFDCIFEIDLTHRYLVAQNLMEWSNEIDQAIEDMFYQWIKIAKRAKILPDKVCYIEKVLDPDYMVIEENMNQLMERAKIESRQTYNGVQ